MKEIRKIKIRICGCGEETLDYAVGELRLFLYEYTAVLLTEDESAQDALIELCIDAAMEPHHYSLSGDGETLRIRGGNASSVLCGVYEAFGCAGLRFDAVGHFLPGRFDMEAFLGASGEVRPKCRLRGVRQHINFPMDISSYPLKEAKEYIRSIARMRFNAITFHSYPGQWHSVDPGGDPNKKAGHFFYGQYHPVPANDPLTAARIHNRSIYCIPEAEAVYHDLSARDEYAKYWLSEVIKTAKEACMTVTLSVELPFDDEERLSTMLQEVCRTYPHIDVLELISYESGGGARIEGLTRDNAAEKLADLFGREILEADGRLPGLGDELPDQLGGAAVSVKRMLTAIAAKDRWLAGLDRIPELRGSLYITCLQTLKILWPIMRRLLPEDVSRSLLPAHGSLAVVDHVEAMGPDEPDWQHTMYYSWVEFDGNMYLQQLATEGLMKLSLMPETESIYGICVNHWRTAENRITLSYAAETFIRPMPAAEFYKAYAAGIGIGEPERFGRVCGRLAALDVYCCDHLFNIGFCYVNCWFRKGSVVRPRGYSIEAQSHAVNEYGSIADEMEDMLDSAVSREAVALLRLMGNRCTASALHIKALLALEDIHRYYDYDNPSTMTGEQRKKVEEIICRSRELAQRYMHLYGEMLPDRGGEGLIVSYSVTMPVFIDAVAGNFDKEIAVEQAECFDAPPAPGSRN